MTAKGMTSKGIIGRGPVTAIVLAGGRSSRFGASKLDAELAGVSVLERTVAAVRAITDDVLVVGRAGSADPAARYLEDTSPFEGPLVGLSTALEASTSGLAIVVGGDMPLLVPSVLSLLLERLDTSGADAAALEVGGAKKPLPVALRVEPARAAAHVAMAGSRRSLRDLLDGLRVAAIPEAEWRAIDPAGDTLLDIDRPPDLAAARARLGGARSI
jgi:molybdopterin-guanine dinucleotide biosynthesis protein A